MSTVGRMKVSKQYSESRVTLDESEEATKIEVGKFPEGSRIAKIIYSTGLTISLGNFEFCRIDVGIELPCHLEEIEECYSTAKEFVDLKLNSESSSVREYQKQAREKDED